MIANFDGLGDLQLSYVFADLKNCNGEGIVARLYVTMGGHEVFSERGVSCVVFGVT